MRIPRNDYFRHTGCPCAGGDPLDMYHCEPVEEPHLKGTIRWQMDHVPSCMHSVLQMRVSFNTMQILWFKYMGESRDI